MRIVTPFLAALVSPIGAFAEAPKNFSEFAYSFGDLINTASLAAITLAVVIYLWGMSTNILEFADDPQKRKAYYFWGIIVLFVMVSIWGIVIMIQSTLFGSTGR